MTVTVELPLHDIASVELPLMTVTVKLPLKTMTVELPLVTVTDELPLIIASVKLYRTSDNSNCYSDDNDIDNSFC